MDTWQKPLRLARAALDEERPRSLEASPMVRSALGPRNAAKPQWKSMEIHGLLGIFEDFLGIFGIFDQILLFLVKIRSESCRRLRDLQKSIVILSNGAVWTRNVTLLMKTLPP